MANLGIIPVMGAEELSSFREEELRQQDERVDIFNDNLAGHIKAAWQIAKEAKRPIEEVMIRCLRQRNGIYEADKLAAIREMGGSEMYVLLTLSKCRAAEAWISDVLRPAGDKPWTIEPTPIPELNPVYEQEVQREIAAEAQAIQQEIAALGIDVNAVPVIQNALMEYQQNLREKLIEESYEEAQEAAEKMSRVMLDQQVQGGFIDSFKQVINDIVTLKAGIMKGPVLRMRKEKKYVFNGAKWDIELKDTIVPEFDRVSPFDFYPAAGSTGVNDGDIIERHFMTRSDLVSLLGVPGYKEEAIREVLAQYQQGTFFEQLPVDTQRYMVEHGETGTKNRTKKFEVLEYWGSVPGKYLLDWGLEGDIDEELEYEINAWMIKNTVIKAIVNPDKLGRKPYSVTAFEKIPGSIWGKGIPEMMSDIQDVCNAVARAIVNNSQLASGPMVEVNVDKCASNTAMHPWKIFQSTNQTMQESPAIHFYQPQMYVAPLQQVYEFFSLAADESTGVPRWAYGNTNVGGAGSTSSGLSMLMTYAARGIKQVIQNIDDDLFSSILQRQYDYNMIYNEDESIKGDVRILARGSSSLIAREQQTLRIKEALQLTANPIDLQLLGLETRLEMIKKMFKAMDIELESIPNPEDIEQVLETIKQQIAASQQQTAQAQAVPENQQAAANGVAPAAKGPQMDNSGQVAGGRDSNLNLPVEARAGGGPVQAGKPYLVGEQGPELVIPTENAVVIPADQTAAAGYVPETPLEKVLNIGQTAENYATGAIEGGALLKGARALGTGVIKQIKPSMLGMGASVAGDWVLPDRLNDMNEVSAMNIPISDNTNMFDYGMLYTPSMKDTWVEGYLNNPSNSNLNFVQRIKNSNPNVALSRPVKGEQDSRESLRMVSDDRGIYPLIENQNGRLQHIDETADGYRKMGAYTQPSERINTTTQPQAEVLAWNEYKRTSPDFGYTDKRDKELHETSLSYLNRMNKKKRKK